jgi:uncharacterized protein YodC (DUF2158 family)
MHQGIYPGAVVTLKFGGPYMVVSDIRESEGIARAYCEWFENSIPRSALFRITSLKSASVFADSSSVKLKKAS